MLLLDNLEQQTQRLSRQEQLKLFRFLQQKLFREVPANDAAQKPADAAQKPAENLTLTAAPEGYAIQTPWSCYDAYEAAANLKAWMQTLPGPKRLDPDHLVYADETIIDLTHH